mgnify:CR=1 FL=1
MKSAIVTAALASVSEILKDNVLIGSEFLFFFFFQAEDGIRVFCLSRGLGDVYKGP